MVHHCFVMSHRPKYFPLIPESICKLLKGLMDVDFNRVLDIFHPLLEQSGTARTHCRDILTVKHTSLLRRSLRLPPPPEAVPLTDEHQREPQTRIPTPTSSNRVVAYCCSSNLLTSCSPVSKNEQSSLLMCRQLVLVNATNISSPRVSRGHAQ